MENDSGKVFPTIQGINISKYKVWEYLCMYDRNPDLASRLRYLAIGLGLFEAWGSSPDLFAAFHSTRHQRIYFFVYLINALFIALGCFLIYESWFWEGPIGQRWRIAYVSIGLLVSFFSLVLWSRLRIIRKNFIHTTRVLTTSQYIVRLQDASLEDDLIFKQLEREILEGAFHKYSIEQTIGRVISKIDAGDVDSEHISEVKNLMEYKEVTVSTMDDMDTEAMGGIKGDQPQTDSLNHSTSGIQDQLNSNILSEHNLNSSEIQTVIPYTEREFRQALLHISHQKNQFNGLPMSQVIDYFAVMCCPSCEVHIPQMEKQDFVRFIKMAFLGDKKGRKIKLDRFKIGDTQDVFHRFMRETVKELHENLDRERYLRLLTDHFEGFDFDKILKNFRSNTKSYLPEVRERYKNDIQSLQRVQK